MKYTAYTYQCPNCSACLTIDTDDYEMAVKWIAEYKKKHKCKKVKNGKK